MSSPARLLIYPGMMMRCREQRSSSSSSRTVAPCVATEKCEILRLQTKPQASSFPSWRKLSSISSIPPAVWGASRLYCDCRSLPRLRKTNRKYLQPESLGHDCNMVTDDRSLILPNLIELLNTAAQLCL